MRPVSGTPELFRVDSSQVGSVRVLYVLGDLDLATEHEFERVIADALVAGPVVVNLEGVRFFAVSGLGVLLRCRRRALAHGHPLVLAAPQRQFQRLLHAARLQRHLPCVRSVSTACALASHIDRARNPKPRMTRATA